jgi:hypothetical protein
VGACGTKSIGSRASSPHRSIDTEAGWSKSEWYGWWYGWKWPLAVAVGSVWIPWAAELTGEGRYLLGDTPYHDPELRQPCHRRGCDLVATWRGPYPHGDGGVEVRKIFHKLRSQAINPFNGLYKNIFEWRLKTPVKGLQPSKLLALGAVVVYQLVWRY